MHTDHRTIGRSVVFLLAITLIFGNSCDNDNGAEPEKNQSLVGAWRMVSVTIKDTPIGDFKVQASQFLELSGTGATTSTLTFNEDGSASLTTTYADSADEVVPGTWVQEGDLLTIGGVGIDDTVGFAVNGNSLTLTRRMPIDFDFDGTPEDREIDMVYSRL
jgi:hypothetical protein